MLSSLVPVGSSYLLIRRLTLLGLYGIQAARTYLEVHPHSRLVIFEGSATAGGVWSQG